MSEQEVIKKKDDTIYLLGALQRLITTMTISPSKLKFIYNMLNTIHKFIEEDREFIKFNDLKEEEN